MELGCGIVPAGEGWALRELAGVPLIVRAVAALAASGRLERVLVPVPAGRAAGVSRALDAAAFDVPVEVAPVADGEPLLRHAAAQAGTARTLVVHDPRYPLATPALVAAVLEALAGDAVGAVAATAVVDTLKWVGPGDVIDGTADREAYRVVCSPQAYRADVLRQVLREAAHGAADLPAAAVRLGPVVTVPASQEVFRVDGADELELAEAVLAASQAGR